MQNPGKLHRADSGLACSLDNSLAQSSVTPLIASLEPISRLKAITILLDQHDDNILAYLRFARSLHQNSHYFPGHGSLSHDQYLAICTLRGCPDDKIRTWLKEARKLGDSEPRQGLEDVTLRVPDFAYLSSSGQVRGSLHAPAARTSPNVLQHETPNQSTLIASSIHPQGTLDRTDSSQEATKATNLYWCTICEDRHSFKRISDWRKHEKGHVETYVCMLGGPVDKTEGFVKCSLCGTSNPSENHIATHNTQICGQGVLGSFSCKRRDGLVQHLMKSHGVVIKAQAAAVADKWKETTKKQAWSCGFCVCLFHTFGERLKHMAKHFERGRTLDEWDITKVIEGLLLQPRMVNVWKTPLGWRSSEITWNTDAVKLLQHNLELGPSDPEHAVALARAVCKARQSDGHSLNDDGPCDFALKHQAWGTSALAPISDHASITNGIFQPSLNHEQSQFVNPAETLHYGVPAMGGDLTATNDYGTLPYSFSDEDSGSIQGHGRLDPGQAWSSAANPYIGYNLYQEQGNASPGMHTSPKPATFNDPNGNNMWG